MSVGGIHTPNSHRARERKATRRQAHAKDKKLVTLWDMPVRTDARVPEGQFRVEHKDKPPKREHRNHGRSGGAKHHLKHRKRTR